MSDPFTTRPTLRGTFGMISSTHWLASGAGMAVLEDGGNAFDAAAAAALVLHVVEPHLNGPGGEVPAILATASDPTPRVLAGQGVAPAGATPAHFRDLGMDLVPGAGPLAAAVPGAIDAWLVLLRDLGTREFADVARFAIGYARHGHPLGGRAAATVAAVEQLFRDDWTTSAALWLPHGSLPVAGELFTNQAWADTLERLVVAGQQAGSTRESRIEATRLAWSQGFVAEQIDAFARLPFRDSSGERHPGVLTGADLAAHETRWEAAAVSGWAGHQIAKTGAWGQGPVLLETLAVLDALGGGVRDPGVAADAHVIAEALELSLADREAWFGDGADTPLDTLLSPAYAGSRAALIGDRAARAMRPGSPDGREPRLPDHVLAAFAGGGGAARDGAPEPALAGTGGEPTVAADGVTRGDTVHVDVVDAAGNIISATPSGGWLQSSPTIPGLGFCLGSRLQMFWLQDGLASTLVPGRRPRTTLSPTLVSRDGVPVLACGTPGGDQQDQWQLLFLLRHLGLGQQLQQAIDAPAWHSDGFPSSFHPRESYPGRLVVEERLGADFCRELRARGHEVEIAGSWTLGRLCAVGRDPSSGILSGAANARGMQGYAAGR